MRVDESAAVQDGRRQHRAEHQPARQPQLADQRAPPRCDDDDQNGKLGERRRTGGDEARHQAAARHGQPELGKAGGNAERQRHHAHGLHDGDGAQVGLVFGRRAPSPGRARRGSRRTAPIARPSHARSAGRTWSPRSCTASRPPAPATLSGNAARPFSVSGDTTAPSEMPTSTEIDPRQRHRHMTGRPQQRRRRHAEQRAGDEAGGKAQPVQRQRRPRPRSPASRPARSHSFFAGIEGAPSAAINAAPGSASSNPRCASALLVPRPLAQHDPHQIGGVLGAELVHDAGAVHLDGARADAERAAGLLVGSAGDDAGQHLALARREQFRALDLAQAALERWRGRCRWPDAAARP